jgi:bacterioferritin
MPNFIADVKEIRRRAAEKIEEGPVTETYKGDVDKTISILNDALATEIVCVLRYMHHYFMATGVHAMAVRDEFKEHADAEREHADKSPIAFSNWAANPTSIRRRCWNVPLRSTPKANRCRT